MSPQRRYDLSRIAPANSSIARDRSSTWDRRRVLSTAGIDTVLMSRIGGSANPIRQLPKSEVGTTRRSRGTLARSTPLITLMPGQPTAHQRSVSEVIWLNGSKPQLSLLITTCNIVLDVGLQPACSPSHCLIPQSKSTQAASCCRWCLPEC
jgi:hypothetical protein